LWKESTAWLASGDSLARRDIFPLEYLLSVILYARVLRNGIHVDRSGKRLIGVMIVMREKRR
jgi:hypothetical protein